MKIYATKLLAEKPEDGWDVSTGDPLPLRVEQIRVDRTEWCCDEAEFEILVEHGYSRSTRPQVFIQTQNDELNVKFCPFCGGEVRFEIVDEAPDARAVRLAAKARERRRESLRWSPEFKQRVKQLEEELLG